MPRAVGPNWRFDHERLQRRLWSPALLLPAAWWDFSDLSTMQFATGASSVTDKSGNGFTATQGTTTAQPLLANQGLSFNGTAHFLATSGPTITGPCTIVEVFNRATTGVAMAGLAHSVNAQPHGMRWSAVNTATAALGNTGTTTHSPTTTTGDLVVITNRDATNTTAFVNGVSAGAAANLTLTSQSFNAIGRRSSFFSNGIIRESMLFQRSLDSVEMDRVTGALAHKYGFASRLPATHPYRERPPTLER